MNIETVKMSSKGQIVIPQRVRELLKAREGSIFAIMENEDSIILKKIPTPSKEELINQLKTLAIEGSKNAKRLGIKESDVVNIVHKFRKSKEKRLEELNKIERRLSKSKFTEKDAEELSEKIKKSLHKRLKDEGRLNE